ncbi:metalloprotease Fpp1 [Croceivirga lutea]|nr:metalloprotease Fpp1 [Croceivirga lutea]
MYSLNEEAFNNAISDEKSNQIKVSFPVFNGALEEFEVEEHSVLHPTLAQKYPEIKSYVGWSADRSKKIRFSLSHRGVQAMIVDIENNTSLFIEKENKLSQQYTLHEKQQHQHSFLCSTTNKGTHDHTAKEFENIGLLVNDQTLRKYRIAVSATGEYTQYHGGTVADALAAINATITRVNEVFETDLGITLELVANNDEIIFTNASTDPYTSSLNSQVQNTLTTLIGEANYDVGHLFHEDNNNGNAGFIGSVCADGQKGSAFSSALVPETDLYDLDYVAHELGHQFGANHTWSHTSEGTGVQAEPASGTTIMGYAGIVEGNNVAANGSDYFHYYSVQQITTYVQTQTCSVNTGLGNSVPVIIENNDYIIPKGTAFMLTASATDTDPLDILTYCWEQLDNGVVTRTSFGPENPVGANFRSIPPSTNPTRYFPRLSRVLNGELTQILPETGSVWETVATIERELNFGLTVRDNAARGGQIASEEVKINVTGSSGPFVVTSQAETTSHEAGSTITVTWDVAGTNQSPINANFVDVFLSTDGGFTYPFTLGENVLNSGSATVQLPGSAATTAARIMIKASDNIFYALNATNFEITSTAIVLGFETLSYTVCKPDDLSVNFDYETFNGFSGTSNLSVEAPAELFTSLSTSTISSPSSSVTLDLTQISNLAVGSYPITVNAISGAVSAATTFTLNVYDDAIEDVSLLLPSNEAVNAGVNPLFQWNALVNADNYDIEIATDELFANVVETATINTTSYQSQNLEAETVYYWRVRANNSCASGNFGSPFSLTTSQISCKVFGADDLPVAIPNAGTSINQSVINVFQDVVIQDVELSIDLEHTFVSDLIISLISPSGTKVVLLSNNCGTSNDISAVFNDDGDELNCATTAPTVTGIVRPVGNLSAFQGESTQGAWILEINDTASGDGGSLVDFSITFCVEGLFRPDEDEDGVFDDGDDLCLGTPKGVEVTADGCAVYRFAQNNFSIEVQSESCRANNDGRLMISAQDTTLTYTANLSGIADTLSETFNETQTFGNLAQGNYTLCISAINDDIVYQEQCFDIVVAEPDELDVDSLLDEVNFTTTLDLNGGDLYNIELNGVVTQTRESNITLQLINGTNFVRVYTNLPCQGEFAKTFAINSGMTVIPNPTQDFATLFLNDFTGSYTMKVFAYDGKLILNKRNSTNSGRVSVDMRELPQGLYFITISANSLQETFRILKR